MPGGSGPMRVAHLSIIHRPFDTRIFQKQCRTLVRAGYETHLIVSGAPQRAVDGVEMHSIDADPNRPLGRRQPRRLARAARVALSLRAGLYHLHDPHLIPLGLLLKARGARVIYDVHEDYPAHARAKLRKRPLRAHCKAALWRVIEAAARRSFDAFVCASPSLAERFPPQRTVVVHNFPLHEELAAGSANGAVVPYGQRAHRVIYTGNVRKSRGIRETIQALELLPAGLECDLRLIGGPRPPSFENELRERRGWDRVGAIVPWLTPEGIWAELGHARVGLALLHPLPNHGDPVRSNKLFEFMAAGIPVIVSDLPEWKRLVEAVGCGVAVDPLDPGAIAAAIERLLSAPDEAEEMGRRGRAAVETTFNWDRDAPRLLSLYSELGVNGAGAASPAYSSAKSAA